VISRGLVFALIVFANGVAAPAAAQPAEAFAEAFAAFASASRRAASDERPVLDALAGLESALAQWDGVIAKMEAGLAAEIGRAPKPAAARMRATLGTAYLERGRSADALRQLDLAVTLESQLAVAHTLRGVALERLKRPREAGAAFAQAWQYGPSAATAYQFLRHSRQASTAVERARARTTVTDAVARTMEASQEPPEFLTLRVIGHELFSPPYAPAAYSDAVAHMADRRFAEGVAAIHAVVFDPVARERVRDEHARLATAGSLIASGDAVAAANALQATAGLFPQAGQAWHRLGLLLEQLGDGTGAVRALEAARKIGDTAEVNEALGRLYHNQLNLDAAAAAYERAVAARPGVSASHHDLGLVYRDLGRLDDAIVEFAMAALLSPASPRPFAELGQMHAAAADDARAVPLLRHALARDASLLAARYALSRALLRLGQREEAARELATFQQQQRKAMEDERRRFDENSKKIDDVLKR
jgi:tetratricopeptide (TPR) repeat protein